MKSDALAAAERHGLPPDMVLAVITIESSWEPYAWNPEPRYRYLWDVRQRRPFRALTSDEVTSKFPPSDFSTLAGDADQEFWGQQASWGLMQVMGAVAREHGFRGAYLPMLCDPLLNLEYGCKHLAMQYRWARSNITQTLAAYNGGRGGNVKPPYRNAAYALKVQQKMTNLEV